MEGGHGVGKKAMVRVIGPSTSVESARALLFVILRYLDEKRAIQKNDLVVRKKLSVRTDGIFFGRKPPVKVGDDSAVVTVVLRVAAVVLCQGRCHACRF